MFKQLKSYYYIHFTYSTLKGCGNCSMNMDEAKRLKKEFKELEDREAVKTEFDKMKDTIEHLKDDCRVKDAELKTRKQQLDHFEMHHKQELCKKDELIEF